MTRDNTTQIIRDTFFELSLCLEAIFLIHKADGELVEAIMRNMEEIYNNATRTMEQGEGHRSYPSVEKFLYRLSGGREEQGAGSGEQGAGSRGQGANRSTDDADDADDADERVRGWVEAWRIGWRGQSAKGMEQGVRGKVRSRGRSRSHSRDAARI